MICHSRFAALLLCPIAFSFTAPLAQARDRPGTPNKGFTWACGDPLLAEPAVCTQFTNTASEDVGFLMDWTENGTHMSSDLSGRSECTSRSTFSCWALGWWFAGNTGIAPYRAARFTTQRDMPEAFKLNGLLWDSEYCFRFRAITRDGVISALYSGFTCARTPSPPGAPGALDPPRLTGIAGTSGEGAIGDGTPFKLLVEWHSSMQSSSNLGWYTIELYSGNRWTAVQKVDVAKLKNDSTPEVVLSGDVFGNGADRQFVRVCADNVAARTCSKEAVYYGHSKPKVATTATPGSRAALLGESSNIPANRPAQQRSPMAGGANTATAVNRGAAYAAVGGTPAPEPVIGPAPTNTFFYVIDAQGAFNRYAHDLPETGTLPAASAAAASGWGEYRDVIPAGGNHFYARTASGELLWFQHDPREEPATAWNGPVVVSRGWQEFTRLIGGGNGVIYALAPDGAIVWYRHGGFATGNPGGWAGPNKLADGWGDFKFIFASGDGVIYVVGQDNRLMAYRHLDPVNGAAAWSKPVPVGYGWGAFAQLFSTGNGVIYGLSTDGKLAYYRHLTWNAATPTFKWVGPVAAGEGFDPAARIVPVLP